ncbi:dynein light chain family protein, partial [Klebsiella quasipneumoniae]
LAMENVALKNVFIQKEIPSEAVDAFMETAVMEHDWNETSEWSWVENETEVIHAVLDALKPETPATDAYLAGIKADA